MSEQTSQLQDKASEVLVNMIDITVKSMNDVIEFGKQQIPEVIHQLLLWQLTSSILWVVVGVFLIFIGAWWCRSVNRWVKTDSDYMPLHVFTVIIFGLSAWAIISTSLNALQIWIAPKVYLIQYAADLVKGSH